MFCINPLRYFKTDNIRLWVMTGFTLLFKQRFFCCFFFLNRGDKGTGGLWFAGITVPAVFWLKWRKPAECKHSGEKWQSNYSVWSWLKGWDQIFSGGCKSIASLNNGWLMGNFFERGPQISFRLARSNEWRRKILTLVWFRMICFLFFPSLVWHQGCQNVASAKSMTSLYLRFNETLLVEAVC